RYLAQPLRHPLQPARTVTAETPDIKVRGASRHNLENVDARFPIGRLSVVTGVSGSGKSTLAREVLLENIARAVAHGDADFSNWQGCADIAGWQAIERVLEVDQTPIGKTPRS